MNPNLKFLVQIIVDMYKGGQERGAIVIVYINLTKRSCDVIHFSLWCLGILLKLIVLNAEEYS